MTLIIDEENKFKIVHNHCLFKVILTKHKVLFQYFSNQNLILLSTLR